jgi:hypothetical protein
MIITTEWIDRAAHADACEDALPWLRAQPRTVADLCAARPNWALWACQIDGWAEVLGAERLDACAERATRAALAYAAALLTPERLDACAAREPWVALRYASALLRPERLDACAAREPSEALKSAAALLTPERLAWCREEAR